MNKLFRYVISLFSFELLLVLFLNAGRYKADPRFNWVPVDLTALFLVLSVAAGAYILIFKELKFQADSARLNFIYFIFAGYALLSLLWTPGQVYAQEKAIYIATLVYWPLLASSIIIAAKPRRIKRFFVLLVLFSCWIAIETFMAYMQSGGGIVTALSGNYLGIGRVIGPAVLLLLGYILYFSRSAVANLAGVGLIGFLLYLLFVVGGRGPLLATLIPFLIPLLASVSFESPSVIWVKKSFPYMIAIVIVAVISMGYLMSQDDAPMTLRRMELLLQDNTMGGSAETRLSYYATTIELWTKEPFIGHGVGSWPVIVKSVDVRDYPHNIVLETLFEFGIAGLLLLISLFVYALRNLGSWATIRTDPYRLIILMVFINALLNAFVSGDIPDNRFLFATLGLMMFFEPSGKDVA